MPTFRFIGMQFKKRGKMKTALEESEEKMKRVQWLAAKFGVDQIFWVLSKGHSRVTACSSAREIKPRDVVMGAFLPCSSTWQLRRP